MTGKKQKATKTVEDIKTPAENAISNVSLGFLITLSSVVIYTVATASVLMVVDQAQPIAYLDEIYHIPQSQEYCRGNFSYWDDRITTLPGLYLLSVGVLKPLTSLMGRDMCETFHLRCTNVVLSACNFLLYVWLTTNLHFPTKGLKSWKGLISALNLAIFPPLYFFSFLYYTDMAAVCLVLLMYNLHLDGRNRWAAAVGVAATLMRQTNIVWTVLVAVGCLDVSLRGLLLAPKERGNSKLICSWQQIPALYYGLVRLKKGSNSTILQSVVQLIFNVLPFILVGTLFVVFVWLNDGLVVGDRSAHQATLHVPQFFYFLALTTAFASPHFLLFVKPFTVACLRYWWLSVPAAVTINTIVHFNTVVHPYLLADNRHYTFYVWKRIFEYRPIGRYLLFPVYMFGAYAVNQTLQSKKSFIFRLAFLTCCFLSLVPQRLLEIRYFFIPYILVRLHVPPQSGVALILEFLAFVIINAVALYLFLYRPFFWPDSPLVQRFMW